MIHLKSVSLKNKSRIQNNKFPYNIPLMKSFEEIEFKKPVTIFVGENGTGKSTLLEGIASSVGSITIGSNDINYDKSLEYQKNLGKNLKLTWKIRTRKGFFLRAEDFTNYVKRLHNIKEETIIRLNEIDEEYKDKSTYVKDLAKMPYNRTLGEMKDLYGDGLEVRSHGESFFDLFHSRFVPNGLYLLDEPETPLSPMKQLAFISMLKDMVKNDSQFIIATHSPIIMAFPNATIINFDELPIKEVNYEDLEHVKLTKSFLNNPEQYLRHL